MPDDFVLKLYEAQVKLIEKEQELSETKQELERIRRDHEELKNQIAANNLMRTGSTRDNKFSEISDTLTKQIETMLVLKNNIGGIDGMNRSSLLMLENNRQNWKQLNIKLPYAVWDHGAQFLNNSLYIFGGCNLGNRFLKWTYKLSESLQWERMTDMNKKRSFISNSNVILNSQIWVCGGRDEKNIALQSVEMYDPLANKWEYMKQMNQRRDNAAAAVVNDKIFCCGGWDGENHLNSVECYDPFSNVWTLISNMPQKIWGHGAVEMNGTFIVIRGTNGENNVWALDITDKNAVWIEKSSMFISRLGSSIANINDKIFVCGGNSSGQDLNDVEIFDGDVWWNGPKMPNSRCYAPVVVIPMEFAQSLN